MSLLIRGAVNATRLSFIIDSCAASGTRETSAAPAECSTSQVTSGACGAPAERVTFELDTAPNFKADPVYVEHSLEYNVQKVLVNAASLADVEFEVYAASGVFKLGYAGAETAPLAAPAPAEAHAETRL